MYSSGALGKNPGENKSFLKTRPSAKPRVFRGCCAVDLTRAEQPEEAHQTSARGRGRTEPRSALAAYFSVLGSIRRAEIPAVAICPYVILAHQRITRRRYGLPNFRTPNTMCIGGVGRAAAPHLPLQHSLAVNYIFLLHFSAKRLVSAFHYMAGSEQNNFSSLKITASTYCICQCGLLQCCLLLVFAAKCLDLRFDRRCAQIPMAKPPGEYKGSYGCFDLLKLIECER